jgi:hypothetical protein
MTFVGKTMVFVNLVASLGVGALAAYSYTARTNWANAYNDLQKHYTISQANAKQYYEDAVKAKSEVDARVAAVESQLAGYRSEIDAQRKNVAKKDEQIALLKTTIDKDSVSVAAAQAEVLRGQANLEQMKNTLNVEINRNAQLVKDAADLRDRATVAEIDQRSLKGILARMEKQYQDTIREVERLKQNGGGRPALAAGGNAANPPPDSVEGQIRATDPTSNLVKLSIGSDSGLAKGHTLEVFSLTPSAKYLGRIRIVEVTAKEAVGQPVGRLADKPKVGDRVASHIAGTAG